ncbi:RDD family protein [Streptomyces sp. V4-01]|uniref:RDD family protein n=1 Tax=Actinacidiphila polyblastidii TaxID=3110430 RepID=A0ABU7P7V4_9ACTN|nr:RDD family protein [Streptomyces sp. V4-01]
MSQPPGPGNPYGGPPQQPYGSPQQPPYPQAGPYGQPAPQPGGHPGVPPQGGYGQPYGYPQQYGGPQTPYGAPYGYPQQYGGYPPPGGQVPGMPPPASWGARFGALLLDWLTVMLVPSGLATAGYVQISIKIADRWNDCDDAHIPRDACPTPKTSGGSLTLIAIGGILSLAAFMFLVHREGATGQTPGKRIVGIRLLRAYDGSTLGFGLALGRRLLHVLDALPCYLGYLWPLWDARKQTFADKMTHTVVIRDPH